MITFNGTKYEDISSTDHDGARLVLVHHNDPALYYFGEGKYVWGNKASILVYARDLMVNPVKVTIDNFHLIGKEDKDA